MEGFNTDLRASNGTRGNLLKGLGAASKYCATVFIIPEGIYNIREYLL